MCATSSPGDPDALVAALTANDSAQACSAAKQLADLAEPRHLDAMLDVLMVTDDHALRDALAISLSDLDDERLLPAVATLLDDPKTEGHRGTLLYALEAFDCRPILRQLVELAVTGGFEVSRQALTQIETIDGEIDEAVWESCVERIRRARSETSDADQLEWIGELADLFEIDED